VTARDLFRLLVEPLWLARALARAETVGDSKRGRVRQLAGAAARRHDAARALRDDLLDAGALMLEREAFRLAVSAHSALHGEAGDPLPSAQAWQELERGLVPISACDNAEARVALASDDALAIDALSPRAARQARIASERIVSSLLRALEWRTPLEIRRVRQLRMAALGCAVIGLGAFGAFAIHYTANVARFKAPSASGVAPGSPPATVLTDGEIGPGNVLRVAPGESPWVSVDLLGRFRLSRVVIHPGVASPADMLPLALEISTDNERWTEVGTRRAPLAQNGIWTVELGGRAVRWLRVRHPGHGSLALSEIEAYAAH
jgi:hypothetical protein